jgi:methionyl-tRNA formyltransferase
MRFAFAGLDRSCSVFEAFIAAGWEPVAMFSVPVDSRLDFNDQLVSAAARHKVPMQLSRIRERDLQNLANLKCEVLIVAGYSWRIPDWTPYLPHAINFHPAPLPQGRGPYPQIQAVLENHAQWGIACQCIAHEFDTGDILDAEHFPLSEQDSHETLQLKLQLAGRELAQRVARDFARLWAGRRAQEGASYWPRITDAQRTLDFNLPVADIMRMVRACGLFECLAPMRSDLVVHVRRAEGWCAEHQYEPGRIVHKYHRQLVVAARDGYIALLEWSSVAPHVREQI